MAIAPSRRGESWLARNMAVGPSAPPIMPIDAASRSEKSIPGIAFSASAPSKVPKMPNCAAPPSKAVLGWQASVQNLSLHQLP